MFIRQFRDAAKPEIDLVDRLIGGFKQVDHSVTEQTQTTRPQIMKAINGLDSAKFLVQCQRLP